MHRLQFWRKHNPEKRRLGTVDVGFDGSTADDGLNIKHEIHQAEKTKLEEAPEDLSGRRNSAPEELDVNDPGYAYVGVRSDPETATRGTGDSYWDRVSNLSFETFKGPKSGSENPAAERPDTTDVSTESSVGHVPVEAIYSEVRKKRPEPETDRSTSAHAPGLNPDDEQNDIESLVMSFDDLLESFRLSLTDMTGSSGASDACSDVRRAPEPDVLPPEVTAGDQRWRHDSQSDADLMMSDEIVIRHQKKSVTFNDVIQERPSSRNDLISDQSEGRYQHDSARHLANGGQQITANGVLPQDKRHHENKMADEKSPVIGRDNGLRIGNGVVAKETSSDNLRNQLPEVGQLKKTQAGLLIVTWFCLGIVSELNTSTYPMTRPPFFTYTETVSRSHVIRGTGNLLAAIFVGVSGTYCIRNHLDLVVIGLILTSITMAVTPWCINLISVYAIYGVLGISEMLIISATVFGMMKLWEGQGRHVVFHLLFMCQALGSAIVPQVAHQVRNYTSNWTLPTPFGDPDDVITMSDPTETASPGGKRRSWFIPTTPSNGTSEDFLLRMPSLLPLYGGAAILTLACVMLICVVIGKLSIRTRRHRARLRDEMTSRKEKLKREIRLVQSVDGSAETEAPKPDPEMNNNHGAGCAAQATAGIEAVLAKIAEVRRTGAIDGHVDEQLRKLLAYAVSLRSQQVAPSAGKRATSTELGGTKTKWLQGHQTFSIGAQMYLYVFLALGAGLTGVYGQFLAIYARVYMTSAVGHEAALLLSLFWASAAAARVAAVVVAKLLSANAMMVTCLVTNIASSAVMTAYAARYPVLLWLFAGLLGASVGPVLPGAFTWADVYFDMRAPKTVALVFGFWSAGVALFPWLCGFVVVNWGLSAIFHMTLSSAALAFLLYIPMLITMSKRRHGNGVNNMAALPIRTYL